MRSAALAALAVLAVVPAGAMGRASSVEVAVDPGQPETVRAREALAPVGGRRCTVPENTPLAALLASGPRPGLRDFASCSKRGRDASGLFVNRLAGRSNKGQDGWVYKIGTKLGTAGAADPSGPFGNGPLRPGTQLLWFYCRLDAATASCQRTLHTASRRSGNEVEVTVTACDDRGRCIPAPAGVTVLGAPVDAAGAVRVAVPANGRVRASGPGLVSSFPERV